MLFWLKLKGLGRCCVYERELDAEEATRKKEEERKRNEEAEIKKRNEERESLRLTGSQKDQQIIEQIDNSKGPGLEKAHQRPIWSLFIKFS